MQGVFFERKKQNTSTALTAQHSKAQHSTATSNTKRTCRQFDVGVPPPSVPESVPLAKE